MVRDPQHRADAVVAVAVVARELGWPAHGVVRSPLPGPAGNVEFFLWLRRADRPGIGTSEIGADEINRVVTAPEGRRS